MPTLRDLQLDLDLQPQTERLLGALRWRLGAGQELHGDGLLTLRASGLDITLDSAAPAAASVRARLLFEDAGPRLGARLRWQDIAVPGRTPAIVTAGTVQLRGPLEQLFVRGDVRAVNGDIDIDAARVSASSLALTLNEVMHDEVALGQLSLHGQGTAAAHSLALAAQGGDLHGALEARGAWAAPRWAGSLTALTLAHERGGRWQLQGTAPLTVAQSEIALGPACLAQNSAKLCVTVPRWSARDASAELHLRALPLALARPWLPASLLPRGSLSADARLSKEAGLWHGTGAAHVERGSVRYRAAGHVDQNLPLRDAQASFQLNGENLRASAKLSLGEWIRMQGTLAAGLGAHAPLRGELLADMPNIRWLEEFVPDFAGSEGSARLQAKLRGVRDAPLLEGELRLSSGSLLLPRFGTRLTALEVAASGAPDSRLALSGQAQVGAGSLSMTGEYIARASGGPRAQLKLRGAQLAVVRLPDIEADAAPDIDLTLAPQAVDLHGRVSWSRVQIDLPSLPERAVATSPDEVVIDGTQGPRTTLPQPPWFVASLAAEAHSISSTATTRPMARI